MAPPQSQIAHEPLTITKEDFDLGLLKPLSYSAESIANALIEFNSPKSSSCKIEELPPRQQRATKRYLTEATWHIGDPYNLDDIKQIFDIFNDNYFNGLLLGYCSIELADGWDLCARYGLDISGRCTPFLPGKELDPRYKLEKPQIVISITRIQDSYPRIYNLQEYMGTLLHEMLHAMFQIYTCVCDHGCSQRVYETLTTGGHHVPWQRAALNLEDATGLRAGRIGPYVKLAREDSVASDMVHYGYELPDKETLKSLKLNHEEITTAFEKYRKDAEDPWRKARLHPKPIKSNGCVRDQWTVDRWERNFGFARGNVVRRHRHKKIANFVLSEEVEKWANYKYGDFKDEYSSGDLADFKDWVRFESRSSYQDDSLNHMYR